jgi:UDP-N-acetylglucosamine--N-acetylmuramyl-(pentapeptide) pyrophosphoryl-undecaprenol N-acetylglucosamine transferase
MNQSKTYFITGGHLTPAVATIEELQKRDPSVRIVFIGRSHATEHVQDRSHEKDEMDRLGVQFIAITTGRIQRYVSIGSFVNILKIPVGIIQAIYFTIREKPSCIVSFGGYVALPVVLAGYLCRIPVITHEQTSTIGLANRIISGFAKKICVVFPDVLAGISKEKGVITGLPIRKEILSIHRPKSGKKVAAVPAIYVTGGSTGAASLNIQIFSLIPELVQKFHIIHQTGRITYADAMRIRESLPENVRSRYEVYDYVNPEKLIEIFKTATLVIGRSGANTTVELATVGIPAILIPLPWSGGGEQEKNARWLENSGSSRVLLQKQLNGETLMSEIQEMVSHIGTYQTQADKFAATMPRNGTGSFVDEVITLV